MNLFLDAFAWIFSPDRLTGDFPLQLALLQHLSLYLRLGPDRRPDRDPRRLAIGHTGRGREFAVSISGAARAIPSFGLLILLVLLLGVLRKPEAAVITFVILAIPSILAGAYTGLEAIDRRVIDAGRAMGMTEWQIPLAHRSAAGAAAPHRRAAGRHTLQVVSTVAIAAYIGLGGLGQYVISGLQLRQLDVIIGGALIIAALALVLDDALFAIVQHLVVPRGIRAGAGRGRRS